MRVSGNARPRTRSSNRLKSTAFSPNVNVSFAGTEATAFPGETRNHSRRRSKPWMRALRIARSNGLVR